MLESSGSGSLLAPPGVQDFYAGRSVLITGASGFMGKVLVEKLLRSCPGISEIYVLLRPIKGGPDGAGEVDAKRRCVELLQCRLFERVRHECPEALSKVVAVAGDLASNGLGFSTEAERTLVDNVSVVFHVAASLKLDDGLRNSLEVNVGGTRRVLQLCSKMSHLVALVYVSTAYSNCDREVIEEVVYPLPCNPLKVYEALEWMDDGILDAITMHLVAGHPNTYTYSKAVAEALLADHCGDVPVAIVRPSIVLGAAKEPFPGWIEKLYGPTGFVIGAGKGIIRNLFCNTEMAMNCVPVDGAINLMVASAWHLATLRPNNLMVFNCVIGSENRLTWGQFGKHLCHYITTKPFTGVVWYPSVTTYSSKFTNELGSYLVAIFPSYFLDKIAQLIGKKPLMARVQQKFRKVYQTLEFFSNNEWTFIDSNTRALWNAVPDREKQDFNFDFNSLSWDHYLDTYFTGTKTFLLKEDPSAVPTARRHLRKMLVIYWLANVFPFLVFWRLLMTRFKTARRLWYWTVTFTFSLLKFLTRFN